MPGSHYSDRMEWILVATLKSAALSRQGLVNAGHVVPSDRLSRLMVLELFW